MVLPDGRPPCRRCEFGSGTVPLGTLRQAVQNDHVDCVIALVYDRGYSVDTDSSPASAYQSALMTAAIANRSREMTQALLQLGIECSEDELEDCTKNDNSEVFDVLLAHHFASGGIPNPGRLMAKALFSASVGCVKVLLDFGVPADGLFEGQSYLEMAVGSGSGAVCRRLLASLPSAGYDSSGCLLHRLIGERPWTGVDDLKSITVMYLVFASLSIDAKDADGSSLLTLALVWMMPEYAAFLLQLGAPIMGTDVPLIVDFPVHDVIGSLLLRRCEWSCP